MNDDAQRKIDAYLERVRSLLAGLSRQEVSEILAELRSHILDKSAAAGDSSPARVDATLSALGSPEELAAQYLTNDLLARAEVSRSPVMVIRSLMRWASLSFAGILVLAVSIVGYFMGCVFLALAVLKPWHPQTAGVWLYPGSAGDTELSFRLGFGVPPAGAHEVLGWWIVPLGLVAGAVLIVVTTRFALWCGRGYRRAHALP